MQNLLCWECGNAFNGENAAYCDYCGVPIGQDRIDVTSGIKVTTADGTTLIVGPLQPSGLRSIVCDGAEFDLNLEGAQVAGFKSGLLVEVWDGDVLAYRSTSVLKVENI